MGIYLNPGNDKFFIDRQSEIYVDKSGLIAYLNRVFRTTERFVCVSRPRRFGKSMAANMIAAYYDHTADTEKYFQDMNIAHDATFREHAGKYDVIHLNMQDFLSRTRDMPEFLNLLQKRVLRDLLKAYPEIDYFDDADLAESMADVYESTRRPFVIVIDEWDCIFREYKDRKDWQEK